MVMAAEKSAKPDLPFKSNRPGPVHFPWTNHLALYGLWRIIIDQPAKVHRRADLGPVHQ